MLSFTWTLRGHCKVSNWPDLNIIVPKEKERDGGTADWSSSQNTYNIYHLYVRHIWHSLWFPKTITIGVSMITDHHNKYNNNEKVWNIARTPKMWLRDMKWENTDEKKWCQ